MAAVSSGEFMTDLPRPQPQLLEVPADQRLRFKPGYWSGLMLKLLGWTFRYDGLPARQGMVVVYPHTSNWDFLIGMLTKWHTGIPFKFWVKDSAFKFPPVGWWLRRVGGVAINRRAAQGMVGEVVRHLEHAKAQDEVLWFALAPEGSRSHGEGWRSGFYHICEQAKVPVGLAYIDWSRKEVAIRYFMHLTGDRDADVAFMAGILSKYQGRRPELASPIRFTKK